jgi:hypothetical protein
MTSALDITRERLRPSRNRWLRLPVCIAAFYGYLSLVSNTPPQVVREHPLKTPISVTAIRGDKLHTSIGSFQLAGVQLPTDESCLAATHSFLHVATAQGVEIIRSISPSSKILRCEPRIYHECGNDPVAAHFQPYNLNELIIALGYASLNPSAEGLTETELQRLIAASKVAKKRERNKGIEIKSNSKNMLTESGIALSDVMILEVSMMHVLRFGKL